MSTSESRCLAYRVTADGGEIWTVIYLIEHGRIRQVFTEQSNAAQSGDIYLARVVQNALPISASFVDTEGGKCFLPGIYPVGTTLPVMIETLAYREKMAKVSTKLSVGSEWMVMTCGQAGVRCSQKLDGDQKSRLKALTEQEEIRELLQEKQLGILFRTKAGEADGELLKKNVRDLSEQIDNIRKRANIEVRLLRLYRTASAITQSLQKAKEAGGVWITESEELYQTAVSEAKQIGMDPEQVIRYQGTNITMAALHGLQGKLKNILSERVWLPSGAEIVITEAEAMCVIDVNSARVQTAKGAAREDVFLKLNLEAATEITEQIVARNISGTILIDFISMQKKESETILLSEMRRLTKGMYPPINVVDITKLGIMETTRQRLAGSIREKKEVLNKTILL